MKVARLEVLGPYEPVRGASAASLRAVYGPVSRDRHTTTAARQILARLARRAYRRPVAAADVDPLVGLVTRARARGECFEDALSLALQALLVSPDFLFRTERGRPASGRRGPPADRPRARLAAVRTSCGPACPTTCCSTSPTRAGCGEPAVLEAQVRRMLRDEKAAALVEAFGGQWLQFRALESVAPDRERFPDFDSGLRLAMRRETELLFLNLLREDRSLVDLIDARYSFRERAAGAALRDRGGEGARVPARGAGGRAPRRDPDARERPDGVVVRDAHLAGAARQVDPREHAERAAA